LPIEIRVLKEGETLEESTSEMYGADLPLLPHIDMDKYIEEDKTTLEDRSNNEEPEHEGSDSDGIVDTLKASKASKVPTTFLENNLPYRCYHRDCNFQSDDEMAYRRHATQNHAKNPLLYPSKAEIEQYGLIAQDKP
jgi:hypothetical protein